MATTTTLVALLLAIGVEVTSQQRCHWKDLQACTVAMTEFADNSPVPLPGNEEELREHCRILADIRECVYNYSLKCVSNLGKSLGEILLSSTAEKMNDLCTPGHEINTMYLRNAKCIADNYDGISTCFRTLLVTLEALPKLHWKERLPGFCCGMGRHRSCVIDHLRKTCDEEAAKVINLIIEFVLSDTIAETCIAIENAVTCPELPPPGTPLDGSYKKNILGIITESFVKN